MIDKKLNDSVKIRNLTIKNRICLPPMLCFSYNTDPDGRATDKTVEHYLAFARGGIGLIIQEATCVSPDGILATAQLAIWDDMHIPGLKRIVDVVHAAGSKIFIQLHHAGGVRIAGQPLSPSNYIYTVRDGHQKPGVEMSYSDIRRVQDDFIAAGRRAFLAGYDGVELHGCHSYLICQFLNHRVNARTDLFGMEPVNFITAIIDGIRQATSDDFVVGIRLGGFEPALTDGIRHARLLEAHGIDFIDVSYGFTGEMDTCKPDDFPFKDIIFAAGEIKKNVAVPVFAVNQIRTPHDARAVLAATNVDMVDIGHSHLVDCAWAEKALRGDEPGKCLDCARCVWNDDPNKCAGRILLNRRTVQ
jgi:NADPH2 dehydrogenase